MQSRNRSGIMMIMAVILLAVLTSVAFAGLHMASGNLSQSSNYLAVNEARMQSESGISYLSHLMKMTDIAGIESDQDLLDAVYACLSDTLDGSPAISDGSVYYDGETIDIPAMITQDGKYFSASIAIDSDGTIKLTVTGVSENVSMNSGQGVSRSASLLFQLSSGSSGLFNYGIAAKGPIRMGGNVGIYGANDPDEAQCLSATYDTNKAFDLRGNCVIDGGISICNGDGYAELRSGSVQSEDFWRERVDAAAIASDPERYEHFQIGIGEVEFPEIDTSVFESFAVNEVNSSTNTSGNKTFTNIRIKANSNKTFSGNITLKGVIFIETPNKIHFSGNVNIIGVVVTQDAGDNNTADNTLKFTGNLSARGVEELPNTPEFTDLREMPGAFVLAPGFKTTFTGNFGTVGGTIAAEEIKWTGNAGGTVRGSIISYGPAELKWLGNATIVIDRDGCPDEVPGMTGRKTFSPMSGSYTAE